MTTEHEHSMGEEFDLLDSETKDVVRRVIEKAREHDTWSEPFRTGDVYAYRHAGGGISWGVNGGGSNFNIARGICRPKTS